MRRVVLVLALAVSSFGCAAAFRERKPHVVVSSDPEGGETKVKDRDVGPTPVEVPVERRGSTPIIVNKAGYTEHRGAVKKKISSGWLAADIMTCVIPVALCIPLIVDAATGAWFDVEPRYVATLEKGTGPTPTSTNNTNPTIVIGPTTPPPRTEMSDSDKKATARAAFIDGLALQEKGDCAGALPKFETAQKYYDAPTHLLHMGQCQTELKKLVEAQESYETLSRLNLSAASSDAFRQAQEQARKDLPALKLRVPSLKIQVTPPGAPGLVVTVNARTLPSELVGLARPVNPGAYRITATAKGMKSAPVDVDVKEGEQKVADVKLAK